MISVFDISFQEIMDNSQNVFPPRDISFVAMQDYSNNPIPPNTSAITNSNFKVKTNVGVYGKKRGQHLFTLQSNQIISSSDIIDISNTYTKKNLGVHYNIYDISKGPHSGPNANITTYTTETALVENLRLQDTVQKNTRRILCIDASNIPVGPSGETRYDVFWMDSRDLDVSGGTNAGGINPLFAPWEPTTLGQGQTGANEEEHIYFHGFQANVSGSYNTLQIRNFYHTFNNSKVWVGIYSSTTDTEGVIRPNLRISDNSGGDFTNNFFEITSRDIQFHTIPISPIELSRNNWYFVALKWSGGDNQFFASDGGQRDNLSWRTRNRDGTAGLLQRIESTGINYDVQGLFWFRLYGDEIAPAARSTPSTSSTPSFSLLNSVSGGPAPKDTDIVDTSSAFIGSVSKYTLSTDISAGQPVCVDISANGPIRAKACDSNTLIQDILGISIETKSKNEEVDILTNGYITARYEPKYTTTLSYEAGTTAMLPVVKMGQYQDEYPGLMIDRNGVRVRDTITVTGPINFQDDNSGGSDNYGNSRNSREVFDVGEGNTFLMKVNFFRFEPQLGTIHFSINDHLKLEYSNDGYHWENLNQRVAPVIARALYFADTQDEFGELRVRNTDLGGNSSASGNLEEGADEGFYFPTVRESSAPSLTGWNEINARFIRFTFHSDDAYEEDGWSIDLNVNRRVTKITGAFLSLDNNKIGSPLYLSKNNYSQVTDDDASGNVLVGYVAGTDLSNDSIYMRTLSFPQSSSAFSRLITTVPTGAGIMGEIRFNTTNNKMYIWNGSTWRVVDTSSS